MGRRDAAEGRHSELAAIWRERALRPTFGYYDNGSGKFLVFDVVLTWQSVTLCELVLPSMLLFLIPAGPADMWGRPRQDYSLAILKPIFFKLFRPWTNVTNNFGGSCRNCGKLSQKFFPVWKPVAAATQTSWRLIGWRLIGWRLIGWRLEDLPNGAALSAALDTTNSRFHFMYL